MACHEPQQRRRHLGRLRRHEIRVRAHKPQHLRASGGSNVHAHRRLPHCRLARAHARRVVHHYRRVAEVRAITRRVLFGHDAHTGVAASPQRRERSLSRARQAEDARDVGGGRHSAAHARGRVAIPAANWSARRAAHRSCCAHASRPPQPTAPASQPPQPANRPSQPPRPTDPADRPSQPPQPANCPSELPQPTRLQQTAPANRPSQPPLTALTAPTAPTNRHRRGLPPGGATDQTAVA
jgi:hypothetical protein